MLVVVGVTVAATVVAVAVVVVVVVVVIVTVVVLMAIVVALDIRSGTEFDPNDHAPTSATMYVEGFASWQRRMCSEAPKSKRTRNYLRCKAAKVDCHQNCSSSRTLEELLEPDSGAGGPASTEAPSCCSACSWITGACITAASDVCSEAPA